MAEGGELGRSQVGASDFIHEFQCTPCSRDGKNSEAEYQCVDCEMCFCPRCMDFHNKMFIRHTVLNQLAMTSSQGQTRQQKPSVAVPLQTGTCLDHPGKVIEMFCGQHNVVCCTVCIGLKHRTCEGVEYIPTVARGILKGPDKQQTQTSMKNVKKELLQLKARREKELSLLNKERDDTLNNVRKLKERIIARVEELEKASYKLVRTRYKEVAVDINSDIASIEDMLKALEVELDKITQFKTNNESQLFVHIKHGQVEASKSSDRIIQIESKQVKGIKHELDTNIEFSIDGIQSFIIIQDYANHPYTANLINEYNIAVKSDQCPCSVCDVCVIDNNQTVITDFNNATLKRLDSTFNVTDWVDIPGGPYSVCRTGHTELAVTRRDAMKVQFVSVGTTLSVTRSFDVGEVCRGICHIQSEIYVCCGGGTGEGPGQVRVYDMSGQKLRTIQTDQQGHNLFSVPVKITVSRNSSHLYIADRDKGFINMTKQGDTQVVINDSRLQSTYGVTEDDRGQLFVCGFKSNNIIQIDSRGNVVQELLTRTDGIQYPVSVTYLPNPDGLLVTQTTCNKIKLFKLK